MTTPSLPHSATRAFPPAIAGRTTLKKRACSHIIGRRFVPSATKGKTGHLVSVAGSSVARPSLGLGAPARTLATHKRNGALTSLSPATCGAGFGPAVLLFHRGYVSSSHVRDSATVLFSKVIKMSLASRTVERFRSRLSRLVERERALAGNATDAIKNVAKKLGMSKINVYRAMNGYGSVTIHAHHYVALLMVALAPASKIRASAKVIGAKFSRRRTNSLTENLAAP